jgi:chemotaxis protein methyltransferase CheR
VSRLVVLRQKTLQITPEEFEFVREFTYEQTANVIVPGKQYLVEFRLAPVVTAQGFSNIGELIEELRSGHNEQLLAAVVDAMTAAETAFFRDTRPFEVLRDLVLPGLLERRADRRAVRVWSIGCSSGQEPYTVAMVLRAILGDESDWDARVVAADVSAGLLAKAREGRYAQIEVNRGLTADLLERHFERDGVGWRLKDDVKQTVEFRRANVVALEVDDETRPDIVLLRNVISVFDDGTRRRVLDGLAATLPEDGFLVLGTREDPADVASAFVEVGGEKSCCFGLA